MHATIQSIYHRFYNTIQVNKNKNIMQFIISWKKNDLDSKAAVIIYDR